LVQSELNISKIRRVFKLAGIMVEILSKMNFFRSKLRL